jgi:hypothetical protein
VTSSPTPTSASLASIESSLHRQLLEEEEELREEELLGCPPELCEEELDPHDDEELVLEEDEPVLEEGRELEELLTSSLVVRAMRNES